MDKIKDAYDAVRWWANEHRKATAVIVAFIAGFVAGAIIV